MYQLAHGGVLTRVLQSYGLGDPINEVKDIHQLANAYESGGLLQTSWLIARA
jgi:hypothetical protein